MTAARALWALVVLAVLVVARASSPGNTTNEGTAEDELRATVFAVAPDGRGSSGAALAGLTARLLGAAGLHAQVGDPPAECTGGASVAGVACVRASLGALAAGAAHVALLPVPAAGAPAGPRLRDAGLEELGDAARPWRRLCAAPPGPRPGPGPARSLLDLGTAAVAARYHVPPKDLPVFKCASNNCVFVPEWCASDNVTCATVVTEDEYDKDVMAEVVRDHRLYAIVVALGPELDRVVVASAERPLVHCHRSPAPSLPRDTVLGPPPCVGPETCAFEPYRLVKFANVRALARSPGGLRALARLSLTAAELEQLTTQAAQVGPAEAARRAAAARPATAPVEARLALLLPASTRRQAHDARSLRRAAELLGRRWAAEAEAGAGAGAPRLRLELVDDGCSAARAYKYLTDALGTGEYGALSALAGPACGAAFADVSRQAPAHALPLLAYSPQAPPPPGAALALLAAGDARAYTALWAALLRRQRWRRLAVLAEPGTRAALDLARLQPFDVTYTELPDDGGDATDGSGARYQFFVKWAQRVASLDLRILYVCLEDGRDVRAALCAGQAAGLRAAVYMLPAWLPHGWLRAPAPCAPDLLAAAALGHLRARPDWLARPPPAPPTPAGPPAPSDQCGDCPAPARLLYDVLQLWAAAVLRLLAALPAARDDLHRPDVVKKLIDEATSMNFTGLTGPFEWTTTPEGGHARVVPLTLQQWADGGYRDVGAWRDGRLQLRWAGAVPDDGGPRCALQPLADALGADCRAAVLLLAALLLAPLLAALAAAAAGHRRRAQRRGRGHAQQWALAAQRGLDRWELPRERVVINRKLGTGAFGTVYGGHALLADDRGWSAVAVKTLKPGATTEEKLDFLSEAEAMKRFEHKNVVRLLGVVTKTEPVCTVMEFMLYGDLKNYLLARRHLAVAGAPDEVSPRRLTAAALDVARALSYLAQLRYVHRDVAARNCLVSAHRVVKLADFGMTRLVFENDYYRFSRKGMLPVRWMAPESLALGVFSPASDVWSFGVLLYEIVTFGSLPFQGLGNSEVLTRVKAGHTLELPSGLKPQLEGLIKSCWRQDAKARPAAAEVVAFLAESPRLLAPCLDVPLDALALDADDARDRAEARWVSWAAPPSAATDTTYLSTDGPHEGDAFLA